MSLVATETFEVEYEGQFERIIAGVTHVIEGHEIARRFPGKFKKTWVGPVKPRSRRAADPTIAPPRETHPWRLPEPTAPTESWRIGPIPNAPRAGTWAEFEWKRTAAHEAALAAAAHLIGWEVTEIRLNNPGGGGHAETLSPVGCRGKQRADGLAFIAATAEKHCGWTSNRNSYTGDRRMIREALSYARNDMEAANYRHNLELRVAALVASPRFRRIARSVTDAVLAADGVLEGEALQEALRAR